MSQKTVITVAWSADGRPSLNVAAPSVVPQATTMFPLNLAAVNLTPDWSQPDSVQAYGLQLLSTIRQAHPGVEQAINRALAIQPGERHAIVFRLSETQDERLYWETACATPEGFLALDPRWPVGRVP